MENTTTERAYNEAVEAVEVRNEEDTAGQPVETDGLVFKREVLNEFLGLRVRS
ncbi:hypothetical protein [Dactylosporangium sp. NPDC005555]|jgi:hypothetical protein|uniref:hypothetical protein n=1 Tax=Dactylosporangium sp. NPDC005555 TaxID=3154889 RepID=UPI00339E5614